MKIKNYGKQMFLLFALGIFVFGTVSASHAQLLNEVAIDPPGTDQPCEYIELKGTPGAALNNLYFVAIEGDNVPSGTADYVFAFSGQTIGSNGILVITGTAACGMRTYPAETTRVQDPTLDGSNGLENGTVSLLLISSPEPIVQGTDYDADNNGTLELLPSGATIVDGVAWTDGGTSDIAYGSAVLAQTGPPDAATRFPDNTTANSAPAWYYGFLTDDGSGNATVTYNIETASPNFPANGMLTPGAVNVGTPVAPSGNKFADFDGDGKSDVSVYRPSLGTWFVQGSTSGFTGFNFGSSTDEIVPGDYDGDGKTDYAVFRPSSGTWFIQGSTSGFTAFGFGTSTDKPVQGDYDGDGKDDIAVYRPSSGTWFVQGSTSGFIGFNFGSSTDIPVPGDFDGDGKHDYAVYRPSSGTWFIQGSTIGFTAFNFGASTDIPVQADYDGDGKDDIAVYRPSSGTWFIQGSTAGFTAYAFGVATDIPVPGDYDGDGKYDVAVYRPSSGTWFILGSTSGFTAFGFGVATDTPVPTGYYAN